MLDQREWVGSNFPLDRKGRRKAMLGTVGFAWIKAAWNRCYNQVELGLTEKTDCIQPTAGKVHGSLHLYVFL